MKLEIEFHREVCGKCSNPFYFSSDKRNQCLEKGDAWWCPYCGTNWTYTKPLVKKLQEQLDALNADKTRLKDLFEHKSERVKQRERSLAAERANKNRLRNAIAKGRCHLCGDEAHNLFIHLKNHHPQWLKEYGE